MVQGLSHMTFIVRDLNRMESILTTILGARRVYEQGARRVSGKRGAHGPKAQRDNCCDDSNDTHEVAPFVRYFCIRLPRLGSILRLLTTIGHRQT